MTKQQDITVCSRWVISPPVISLQLPRVCNQVLVTDYCPLYQIFQKASSTDVPTTSSDSPHKDRFQFGNLLTHLTNAKNWCSFSFEINFLKNYPYITAQTHENLSRLLVLYSVPFWKPQTQLNTISFQLILLTVILIFILQVVLWSLPMFSFLQDCWMQVLAMLIQDNTHLFTFWQLNLRTCPVHYPWLHAGLLCLFHGMFLES